MRVERKSRSVIPMLCLCAVSCSPFFGSGCENAATVSIVSWNLQNLFDAADDGTEYAEYDPAGGDWTEALYEERLELLAGAVGDLVPGGPDILLFQEIENRRVLEDLSAALPDGGYDGIAFSPRTEMAVNVGVLSRLPIRSVSALLPDDFRGEPLRPILEIRIDTEGGPLYVFNNHWKSKVLAGVESASAAAELTEAARIAAAGVLVDRIRELLRDDPSTSIVVMGDFNESPDEFGRAGGAYPCALMRRNPGDGEPSLPGLSWTDESEAADPAVPVLFNAWTVEDFDGSYFYDGEWERIDGCFLSSGLFDGVSIEMAAFRVVREEPFLDEDELPFAWRPDRGQRGYSDHLPLLLILSLSED